MHRMKKQSTKDMIAGPETIQDSIDRLTKEIIDFENGIGMSGELNNPYLRDLKLARQKQARGKNNGEWLANARERLRTLINLKKHAKQP